MAHKTRRKGCGRSRERPTDSTAIPEGSASGAECVQGGPGAAEASIGTSATAGSPHWLLESLPLEACSIPTQLISYTSADQPVSSATGDHCGLRLFLKPCGRASGHVEVSAVYGVGRDVEGVQRGSPARWPASGGDQAPLQGLAGPPARSGQSQPSAAAGRARPAFTWAPRPPPPLTRLPSPPSSPSPGMTGPSPSSRRTATCSRCARGRWQRRSLATVQRGRRAPLA